MNQHILLQISVPADNWTINGFIKRGGKNIDFLVFVFGPCCSVPVFVSGQAFHFAFLNSGHKGAGLNDSDAVFFFAESIGHIDISSVVIGRITGTIISPCFPFRWPISVGADKLDLIDVGYRFGCFCPALTQAVEPCRFIHLDGIVVSIDNAVVIEHIHRPD